MCDLKPEGCVVAHLCPRLDGRRGEHRWSAVCPAPGCKGRRSLTIWLGDRQRITWNCNAGCDSATVKQAMIARGISRSCIPWSGRSHTDRSSDRSNDDDLRAWLEELVKEPASGNALRLQIALRLWPDMEDRDVASKLGMSQATYYRYRPK
jgi:hypothetical protein